jgi:hypothetical protein
MPRDAQNLPSVRGVAGISQADRVLSYLTYLPADRQERLSQP